MNTAQDKFCKRLHACAFTAVKTQKDRLLEEWSKSSDADQKQTAMDAIVSIARDFYGEVRR